MGQNQSSEEPREKPRSRGGTPHARDSARSHHDRRVDRRPSTHPMIAGPAGPSQPVDASATNAVARGTTAHNHNNTDLERMLQSNSPTLSHKSSKVERSTPGRKKDVEALPKLEPNQHSGSSEGIDIPSVNGHYAMPVRTRHEELYEGAIRSPSISEDRTYVPAIHNSAFHRPPRLPLPIAEVPDSPSLGPEQITKNDSDVPIFTDDSRENVLRRSNSIVSIGTQDDEEDAGEELQPFGTSYGPATTPFRVEYRSDSAHQIFVTGTFTNWEKKYRMYQSEADNSLWYTTVRLPAGTHHLKFFVDGAMRTSPDIPTAVDFNNFLVNYVEISADEVRPGNDRRESVLGVQKEPPKAISPRTDIDKQLGAASPAVDKDSGTVTPGDTNEEDYIGDGEIPPEEILPGDYRQLMPQALVDIETPEGDERCKIASRVISDAGQPPHLPLFLSRSILNVDPTKLGMKDDSSVLAMPNHTVLNHLMTSNVKNKVLATAVTTRYRKKYVTTISFKPVPK